MENDVLDALTDIGYDGPLSKPDALNAALDGGPKSPAYTELVSTLASELRSLCGLEEVVGATQGPEEASHFLLELSSFLKEVGCPYMVLCTGHMSSRLQSKRDRLLLLDYLLSEVMASRMLAVDKPQETNSQMEVTIQETPTAKDLNDILTSLKMSQPPPNISPQLLFTKLKEKLKNVIQQEGQEFVGHPLYNQALTEKQWKEIEQLHRRLLDEYKLRREMLITRLDCTVQSFEWKGKAQGKNEKIQSAYRPLRQLMRASSSIRLGDFLAARKTLLTMRKTSDAAVRVNTRSQVNKVVIGRVPDRGGRPSEQQPPPPEMPSWQQQRSQGGGGRGGGQGGSGFGRGGGGRVQGGWNQQPGEQRGGGGGGQRGGRNQGFQDNRSGGGFQDNRGGGYQDNRGGSGGGGYKDNRGGGYQDNRGGGYQDNRGGGYQDNRGGGFQDNRGGGFQDNRGGGYQDSRGGGYQDSRGGGYQDSRGGGYNDNRGGYRNSQGGSEGYHDNNGSGGNQTYDANRGSYSSGGQKMPNYQTYVIQNPGQTAQGYQTTPQGYQTSGNQGYQTSGNQGYQTGKNRYQNEHDDRTTSNYDRGSSGRGRSSYNRGGRN